MQSGRSGTTDLHIAIESEGGNKYRIRSDHLGQIGEQLRGRRQFPWLSIALSVIAAVITTLVTGVFQYVSWANSVSLQDATDSWNKASATYESAAAAISRRHYATLLFIPTVRELVRSSGQVYRVTAPATDGKASAMNAVDAPNGGHAVSLTTLQQQLLRHRYEGYYAQLKDWNDFYDRTSSEIEHHLDRPIMRHARQSVRTRSSYWHKFEKDLDCSKTMTDELARLELNKHSLKVQFTAIQFCFIRLSKSASDIARTQRLDELANKQIDRDLDRIYAWGTQFRCYAQRRVDYYRRQQKWAIVSHQTLWRRLFRTQKYDAERSFEVTATRCDGEYRIS
jgi:hypothetical protein